MDNTHLDPRGTGRMDSAPLTRAVLDIDSYAAGLGWDLPARLFALVDTVRLREHQPELADRLAPEGTGGEAAGEAPPGDASGPAYTPVEQDELPPDVPLDEFLATIAWPEAVDGCALTLERLMLPPGAEAEVPQELRGEENAEALGAWVAGHPQRQEVRMTVGVLRSGAREAAIRLRAKDSDQEVLTGRDLVPGLAEALAATFEE
ncbi:PPA1309 family protein [Streptomyces sp. YIM 98790]|uniref:PPA1309 family protein n=1 Tax=Streptomyces sp. YIM 98790 TaxID=2689077 RepID=UPI00140B9912|nr:PPA1309 family protein [Streptomyces sp. YIM 98790]